LFHDDARPSIHLAIVADFDPKLVRFFRFLASSATYATHRAERGASAIVAVFDPKLVQFFRFVGYS
jgi:hypothetical protein